MKNWFKSQNIAKHDVSGHDFSYFYSSCQKVCSDNGFNTKGRSGSAAQELSL